MTALTSALREFLDSEPVGVLATQAADGRPRQSLVYLTRELSDETLAEAGRVILSITVEKVTAANYMATEADARV